MEARVASFLADKRTAVVEAPASAEAWGTLGGAYEAHGLLDPAERCYEAALALAPDAFDWAYLLAIVRDVNGADAEEVGRRFEDAAKRRPDYAPLYLRFGRALAIRGEHDRAIAAFRRALVLDPDSAAASLGLGQSLVASGNPEAALEALERASRLRPDDRGTFLALAQVYRELGRTDEAGAAARQAATLRLADDIPDPVVATRVVALGQSARHWIERGERYVRAEDWASALEAFRQLAEIRPTDAHVAYSIGSTLARLGRTTEARSAFDRALALDPDHAWARFELAALAEAAGQPGAARDLLVEAVALEGRERSFFIAIARVSARLGDWAAVVSAYERLAEIAPLTEPGLLSNWGNALVRLGRDDEAIAIYERALAIDPHHANTLHNLGVLRERTKTGTSSMQP